MKSIQIRFFGQVQGVGFRSLVQRIAISLSLTGWVKNEEGGTVLALVCGSKEAIDAFILRTSNLRAPLGPYVQKIQKLEEKKESGNSCPYASFLVAP